MENDSHEKNTGTQETRGDEDYNVKPKQNHCYGHTPRIQKGAKTSNSGVERNTIRYSLSVCLSLLSLFPLPPLSLSPPVCLSVSVCLSVRAPPPLLIPSPPPRPRGGHLISIPLSRPVGLVVRASASRASDPWFECRMRHESFFLVESYQ